MNAYAPLKHAEFTRNLHSFIALLVGELYSKVFPSRVSDHHLPYPLALHYYGWKLCQ